jgi:hypothetical protein
MDATELVWFGDIFCHTISLFLLLQSATYVVCNTPKIGLSIFVLLFLPSFPLPNFFPLESGEWPGKSRQSSASRYLSDALVPVKFSSVNPEPHSNPGSKISELEILPLCLQRSYHFPCSVDPPKISRDHPSLINPRCAKILLSHMQYFSSRINSSFCLSEELNPGKYLFISKVHENVWRYSLWSYWALTKILAIIK